MKPDRVVIGSDNPKAREILRHLYTPFVRATDHHPPDGRSLGQGSDAAPANALLASRISFMNDLAAPRGEARRRHRARAQGRWGPTRASAQFLFAWPGLRRLLLPQGPLRRILCTAEPRSGTISGARAGELARMNARQKHAARPARCRSPLQATPSQERTIAVTRGLAFKPQTDDVRGVAGAGAASTALLAAERRRCRAHDPAGDAERGKKCSTGNRISFAFSPDEMPRRGAGAGCAHL